MSGAVEVEVPGWKEPSGRAMLGGGMEGRSGGSEFVKEANRKAKCQQMATPNLNSHLPSRIRNIVISFPC